MGARSSGAGMAPSAGVRSCGCHRGRAERPQRPGHPIGLAGGSCAAFPHSAPPVPRRAPHHAQGSPAEVRASPTSPPPLPVPLRPWGRRGDANAAARHSLPALENTAEGAAYSPSPPHRGGEGEGEEGAFGPHAPARPPNLPRPLPEPPGLPMVRCGPPRAPVAQLDRALPSEGRGHRFESCRVRQPDSMG